MCAKRHERSYARRCALQVLYQSEILDEAPCVIMERGSFIEDEAVITDYVVALVNGVDDNKNVIDGHLKDTSENWSLERMPIVDKSILRLTIFEMMFVDDVPLSVSINEAVELAKDFGGEDDSPRFVNGILGRIAKLLEEDHHGKSE